METRTPRASVLTVLSVALLIAAMVTLVTVALRTSARPASASDETAGAGAPLGRFMSDRDPSTFADCLEQAGVPATVDAHGVLRMTNPGRLSMSRGADGSMRELRIDGQDYAEAYNACRDRFPDQAADREAPTLDDEELADLFGDRLSESGTAQMDEAARAWAACAREHGFDTLPDPRNGIVTLPGDLTVEAAESVAAACPLGDFDRFGFGLSSSSGFPPDGVFEALTGGSWTVESSPRQHENSVTT